MTPGAGPGIMTPISGLPVTPFPILRYQWWRLEATPNSGTIAAAVRPQRAGRARPPHPRLAAQENTDPDPGQSAGGDSELRLAAGEPARLNRGEFLAPSPARPSPCQGRVCLGA